MGFIRLHQLLFIDTGNPLGTFCLMFVRADVSIFSQRFVLSGWKIASDFLWSNFNKNALNNDPVLQNDISSRASLNLWMLAPSCGFHKNAQNLIGTQWYVFIRLPRFPLETTLTLFAHLVVSRNSNIATSSQPTTTQPSSWGLSFSWQRWWPAPYDDDDANITLQSIMVKEKKVL